VEKTMKEQLKERGMSILPQQKVELAVGVKLTEEKTPSGGASSRSEA